MMKGREVRTVNYHQQRIEFKTIKERDSENYSQVNSNKTDQLVGLQVYKD